MAVGEGPQIAFGVHRFQGIFGQPFGLMNNTKVGAFFQKLLYNSFIFLRFATANRIDDEAARFDLPLAREFIRDALKIIAPDQRKRGTFGGPCEIEKVVAVLVGIKALG